MKTTLKKITIMLALISFLSCSKKDETTSGIAQTGNCISGSIALVQTNITNYPSSNVVFIDFDAKNNSTINYDVATVGTGNFIYAKAKVKTTDGNIYETVQPIITQLSAGATQSVLVQANYGAGKTYDSYTIELICK